MLSSLRIVQIVAATSIVGSMWLAWARNPGDQQKEAEASPIHDETPVDPFIPVRPEERRTSPAQRWTRNGYVSVQVNVDEFGNNILGDAANEPSIAVDPTNRARKAIGWRQFDTVESSFRQAGWGYTADGGETWTFPGVLEPGVFRSDPVLDSDADGRFFFYSVKLPGYSCQLFKSIDGGVSWDDGIDAYGGDKPWMTIDRTDGVGGGNLYMTWGGLLTRSYDGGQAFIGRIHVPGSPYFATLSVGPDGELYVAGYNRVVAKSSTIQDESLPVSWDFSITVDLGGEFGGVSPNPGGLSGQPWIAVDHSAGPTRGNVYLLGSVDPPGDDPLDVMFIRSTDGGQTWSAPVRVNDDPLDNGAWQWFGTMSVAPNGRIDAIWNDTRGGGLSEVYYARSDDGGQSWSANEAVSPPFDSLVGGPSDSPKLGDYYHMVSDSAGADLAYAATFNGEHDVYYMRIGGHCADAGTCALDRRAYTCEDTATVTVVDCGLNANDELAETVAVTVESDSEPAGEALVLSETDIDSARFVGSIPLSQTDAPGVVHVSEGDALIAIYDDTDDGTGSPASVTDSVIIECTPPAVFDVQTTKTGPVQATVTFETDEPAIATVRYGTSCDSLSQSACGARYLLEHSIVVTQLESDTTYFFAIDVEDVAGNQATEDNGGSCYDFLTMPRGQPIAKLLPSDGAARDYFGESGSVSGEAAVIGAYSDDDNGSGSGSAYVFRFNGSNWVQEAKLLPDDGDDSDRFGNAVSLSGDVAVIGAYRYGSPAAETGAAYCFRNDGSGWVQEAKLLPSDSEWRDEFGCSVSVFGDTAVVGACDDDDNGDDSGSAYCFRFDGSNWVQQTKLLPSDGDSYAAFGWSVSVGEDIAVIGAPNDDDSATNAGAAYVFRFNGSSWIQDTKLLADDAAWGDGFGRSVALSDGTIVVGAPNHEIDGAETGSAYCFRYDGSEWVQEAKLLASDGAAGDYFGDPVSVSGDIAVIGATGDDDNGDEAGSAYVFRFDGSRWILDGKLLADDGATGDDLGWPVAVSGDTVVVGASRDDDNGDDSGSAYVFQLGCPRRGESGNHCTGDVYPSNGDGVWLHGDDGDCMIDISDLGALLVNYGMSAGATRETGDVYPIGVGDGAIDTNDLLTVLTQYGDACN